jgi:type II secretory pathway pseudopilin PulG
MKKQGNDGFTLMETLVTMGITLVLGGILASVFSTGLKGTGLALAGSRTASQIAQTDRMIREWAEDLHIPYWAKPDSYVEGLMQSILRSKIGGIVTSVRPVYDNKKRIRGIAVDYRINNKEMQTRALFPGSPVLDR